MKPGKILSLGLLSAMLVACNSGTESTPATEVDGRTIAPAVNALTKAAALQAGFQMSREAVADKPVNPFDTTVAKSLGQIGVCQNFIDLINELAATAPTQGQTLMKSERFMKVVSCFETEAQGLSDGSDIDAVFALFDKCFCDGSGGSVFGAIAGYAWTAKYKAPQLSAYKAPATGNYKSPSLGNYKSPSLGNYKSPGL